MLAPSFRINNYLGSFCNTGPFSRGVTHFAFRHGDAEQYSQSSKNQLPVSFAALAYTAASGVFGVISIMTMKTLVFYFAGWCDPWDHALLAPVFACIFSKDVAGEPSGIFGQAKSLNKKPVTLMNADKTG